MERGTVEWNSARNGGTVEYWNGDSQQWSKPYQPLAHPACDS